MLWTQNSARVWSLILLFLLLVVLVVIIATKNPSENFSAKERFQPASEEKDGLSSGIARCKYGGYTPILTCSYQAFDRE